MGPFVETQSAGDPETTKRVSGESDVAPSSLGVFRQHRPIGHYSLILGLSSLVALFAGAFAVKCGARLPIFVPQQSERVVHSDPSKPIATLEVESGLSPVLARLPTLAAASEGGVLSIPRMCHILIVGLGETGLPEPRTGWDAFRLMTDERLAKAAFGKSPFIRTRHGMRYRLAGNRGDGESEVGEAHRDQCLCTFAGLKVSLDEVLTLESERLHLRDLLSESIANFTFEQSELPFTVQAYAHYLPPVKNWTDRFGKTTTFSDVLHELMKRGFNGQSCAGLHVLRAVIATINADTQYGILNAQARVDADAFLRMAVANLTTNQRGDGSWDSRWNDQAVEGVAIPSDSIEDKLIATGHMLEILHELRPPPRTQVIVRSCAWLLETLATTDFKRTRVSFCPLAHCALSRATFLCEPSFG